MFLGVDVVHLIPSAIVFLLRPYWNQLVLTKIVVRLFNYSDISLFSLHGLPVFFLFFAGYELSECLQSLYIPLQVLNLEMINILFEPLANREEPALNVHQFQLVLLLVDVLIDRAYCLLYSLSYGVLFGIGHGILEQHRLQALFE